MHSDDTDNAPAPFGATVVGYGYAEAGGPMADYLARELERRRAWRVADAAAAQVDPTALDRLRADQRARQRRLRRGEPEGPPNPYAPHRK